jgi:hypothetical protein
MTDRPTCKTCRFWAGRRFTIAREDDCRRRAPALAEQLVTLAWHTREGLFPRTRHDSFCGDHEPEPEREETR